MMTHERRDAAGDVESLERKIAELRLTRAQMHAERDEHARNAARAATVRDGLASLYAELTALASDRDSARDAARREREAIATDLARLAHESDACDAEIRALGERIDEVRARAHRIATERDAVDARARAAADVEATAAAQRDDTSRSAAELKTKLDAATNDAELAASRSSQFAEIALTLDREEAAAEAALAVARARDEAQRLQADLERIRTMEARLASERAELERRLSDLAPTVDRENDDAPSADGPHDDAPQAVASETDAPGTERQTTAADVADPFEVTLPTPGTTYITPRVSLAKRLQRDFGAPV